MNISPREKMIAVGVGAVLALYALDQVVLQPLFDRLTASSQQIADSQITLTQANAVSANGDAARALWHKLSSGHISADPSAAQSTLLNHIDAVAKSSGLSLTSFKTERGDKTMDFVRTGVRASGTATMATLTAFMQRLPTSDLPVRVTDLQIKAAKDGTDDLVVDMGIATIYQSAAAEGAK